MVSTFYTRQKPKIKGQHRNEELKGITTWYLRFNIKVRPPKKLAVHTRTATPRELRCTNYLIQHRTTIISYFTRKRNINVTTYRPENLHSIAMNNTFNKKPLFPTLRILNSDHSDPSWGRVGIFQLKILTGTPSWYKLLYLISVMS